MMAQMIILAAVQTPERVKDTVKEIIRKPYPKYKIIVLDDDFNTFEHVADCLMKYIPGMNEELAWELTNQVHHQGFAIVWVGPMEQAELYHAQLKQAGLTMAPLEPE